MYLPHPFIKQLILIPLAALVLFGCNNAEHHEGDQKDTIEQIDTSMPEMVISKPDTPSKVSVTPPPPPPPVTPRTKDYPPPIEVVEEEMVDVEPPQEYVDYVDKVTEPSEPEVFMVVEEMPEFPGGQAALSEFIKDHLLYPPLAVENGIEGKVIVRFIVTKTGDIMDAEVLKHIQFGTGEEALRIVKLMPRWKPGKQRGKAVDVQYILPIKFELR